MEGQTVSVVAPLILDYFDLANIRVFAEVSKRNYNLAWTYWQSRCVTISDELPLSKRRIYITTTLAEMEKYKLHQRLSLCQLLSIPQRTRKLCAPARVWSCVREGCLPHVEILTLTHNHNTDTQHQTRSDHDMHVQVKPTTFPQLTHLIHDCNLRVSVSDYASLDRVTIYGTCMQDRVSLYHLSNCAVTTLIINVTNHSRQVGVWCENLCICTQEKFELYLDRPEYREIYIRSPHVTVYTTLPRVNIARLIVDAPEVQLDTVALHIKTLCVQPHLCRQYMFSYQVYPLTSTCDQSVGNTCTLF